MTLVGVEVDRWWELPFVEFVAFFAGAPRREATAGEPVQISAVVLARVCVPAALLPAAPLLGS